MEEKKAKKQEIIETEIQMGTVHPAALEPYRAVSYTHLTLPTNREV